jgi:regulator of replication initiation timing
MLREIRKYTKEMAPLINETHVEEMENRKIKPRLDKYYEKEKLHLREPKSISK